MFRELYATKRENYVGPLFVCISNVHFFAPEARPFYAEPICAISERVTTERELSNNLMLAVRFDAKEAVVKLIERGANIEGKEQDEWTALHTSSTHSFTRSNVSQPISTCSQKARKEIEINLDVRCALREEKLRVR